MEQIIVSDLLKKELPDFYNTFKIALKDYKITEISLTNDIWCRDFMPVKRNDGKYVLFNYNPSYLKPKWQYKLTPRKNIISICKELNIEFIDGIGLNLDGGNVVQSGDRIIMTDVIYHANGIKEDKKKQDNLIKRLEKMLEAEILIIPHQPDDPLSHSDGVVRFLDQKTVLVNNFSSVEGTDFEESKHYLDNMFGALGKAGLNIIQVPYSPVDEIGEDGMPVALGIYINYLETNRYVFLPQFREAFEEKDHEAIKVFSALFKRVNKTVVPMDSRSIALKGGVLNCITWN